MREHVSGGGILVFTTHQPLDEPPPSTTTVMLEDEYLDSGVRRDDPERDLRLAFRRPGGNGQSTLVLHRHTSLFPLGIGPKISRFSPNLLLVSVWVCALLATLLALDSLFRTDLRTARLSK